MAKIEIVDNNWR